MLPAAGRLQRPRCSAVHSCRTAGRDGRDGSDGMDCSSNGQKVRWSNMEKRRVCCSNRCDGTADRHGVTELRLISGPDDGCGRMDAVIEALLDADGIARLRAALLAARYTSEGIADRIEIGRAHV